MPERGLQPVIELLAASGSTTAGKRKQCEFMLSLSASLAGNASAAAAAGGLSSRGGGGGMGLSRRRGRSGGGPASLAASQAPG